MPLRFTGNSVPDSDDPLDTSLEAFDVSTNKRVVVIQSVEAGQDHDIYSVQGAANRKYDAGDKRADGSVYVRTEDC